MDAEEALEFLSRHQPMPSDTTITESECEGFCSALQIFQERLDSRCIPLFINTVSLETGIGMYEDIRFVLMAHDRAEVAKHIEFGLINGSHGVQYRCCWWLADVDAWHLVPLLQPLLDSDAEEVRDGAAEVLKLHSELLAKGKIQM